MLSQGCRIVLKGEAAREFFYLARHPDMEELRRRDEFFAKLDRELHYTREGADLVMEIPDIDLHGGDLSAVSVPVLTVMEIPDIDLRGENTVLREELAG